jgi:hypothetical protein
MRIGDEKSASLQRLAGRLWPVSPELALESAGLRIPYNTPPDRDRERGPQFDSPPEYKV